MKKIISLVILIIGLFFYLTKGYYKEEIIINNKTVFEEIYQGETVKEDNTIPNNYLGYLIIDSLNIKNLILNGTNDAVLNKNVVGVHKASANLDDLFGNIILAGHNNKYVFHNLSKIKFDTEIKLITKTSCYRFRVIDIKIYPNDDYSYYKTIDNKKVLTLITCYGNNSYRLVVTAFEIS